jgi:hypothetical protein
MAFAYCQAELELSGKWALIIVSATSPSGQKNVRQKNGRSYFSVLHFSVRWGWWFNESQKWGIACATDRRNDAVR